MRGCLQTSIKLSFLSTLLDFFRVVLALNESSPRTPYSHDFQVNARSLALNL